MSDSDKKPRRTRRRRLAVGLPKKFTELMCSIPKEKRLMILYEVCLSLKRKLKERGFGANGNTGKDSGNRG